MADDPPCAASCCRFPVSWSDIAVLPVLCSVLKTPSLVDMFWSVLILAAVADAAPQRGGGGGIGGGRSSLIRFGCSQVVIDRIDP